MKYLIHLLCIFGLTIPTYAQSEEEAIMSVVQSVFDGMATNDGNMVREAFTEDAQTFTVTVNKEGEVVKRSGSVEKFAEAVSAPKEKAYNEPIWNEQVEIDGPLASVWVDYAFYLGDEFHHCGVDAFHLMKTADGWKIFHLVDTRRTANCKVPGKIRKQYEN